MLFFWVCGPWSLTIILKVIEECRLSCCILWTTALVGDLLPSANIVVKLRSLSQMLPSINSCNWPSLVRNQIGSIASDSFLWIQETQLYILFIDTDRPSPVQSKRNNDIPSSLNPIFHRKLHCSWLLESNIVLCFSFEYVEPGVWLLSSKLLRSADGVAVWLNVFLSRKVSKFVKFELFR